MVSAIRFSRCWRRWSACLSSAGLIGMGSGRALTPPPSRCPYSHHGLSPSPSRYSQEPLAASVLQAPAGTAQGPAYWMAISGVIAAMATARRSVGTAGRGRNPCGARLGARSGGQLVGVHLGVDGVQHGQPGVVDGPGGVVDRRRSIVFGPGRIVGGDIGVDLVGPL